MLLFVHVTVFDKNSGEKYGLIELIMVEEDNKEYNKVDVEFLQIQVPLVPGVELALVRRL